MRSTDWVTQTTERVTRSTEWVTQTAERVTLSADWVTAVTPYHETLNQMKQRLIVEAVKQAGGNITRAAEALGLHPNYLHRLISNLGLRDRIKD